MAAHDRIHGKSGIGHCVIEGGRAIALALGSPTSSAIKVAVRPGVVLATIGVALGYVLSRWASNVLRSVVFGVQVTDSTTYVTVGLMLLLAAALASFLPSLRIATIDPARTLREE
jgi:ABC-type lipoprotein release transport system permease subunit